MTGKYRVREVVLRFTRPGYAGTFDAFPVNDLHETKIREKARRDGWTLVERMELTVAVP